jgi:dolichyl-phosphate-mannose--protein O-mannosyl transferase
VLSNKALTLSGIRLSHLTRVGSSTWLEALAVCAGALAFFLYGISQLADVIFDESFYVAAAKAFLTSYPPKNLEHPPLGKLLMAIGMSIFGENAFGWRFPSAFFGAISLASVHAIGRNIFAERRTAWICTGLTFFNGILYVQSRIAMLDIFMIGFVLAAMLAAILFMKNPEKTYLLILSAALCGCAVASKEFAVIPVALLTCVLLVSMFFRKNSDPKTGARALSVFVAVAFACYIVTFVPYLSAAKYKGRSAFDVLLSLQYAIFKYQLLEIRAAYNHPYASKWWEWVLSLRPIWYHYGRMPDDPSYARGILMLGNPLVMLGGLLAILHSIKYLFRRKSVPVLVVVVFYGSLTFCWPLLARKEAYYFYYAPAAMVLGFALAFFLERIRNILIRRTFVLRNIDVMFLLASAAIFAYFYPVLSGRLIKDADFFNWIWLESWL